MRISEVMTKEVIAVTEDTSIGEIAEKLIGNRIHGVPVLRKGKPVGIITQNQKNNHCASDRENRKNDRYRDLSRYHQSYYYS